MIFDGEEISDHEMMAHIICWDGIEYDRPITHEELNEHLRDGIATMTGETIVFNFKKGEANG